jgi:hypothetical protein
MRIRITMAAAVLALGFATITAARQGAEKARPQDPADSKAALRPRLARLRAEVELMQLEHEGDVAVMRDLIKGLKFAEAMGAAGNQAPLLEELRKQAEALQLPNFMPKLQAAIRFPGAIDINQVEEIQNKAQALVDEASVKLLRKIYEESKKGFFDRAAALNEKQMELLELEQRMSMIP